MGAGDDIMSTAYVEALREQFPKSKFVMGDGDSQTMHWSDVFENNPRMLQKGETYRGELIFIPDYPGRRAYIDYAKCGNGRFAFDQSFAAPVGKIYFTEKEQAQVDELKGNFVVIEPNVKGSVSAGNKDWGFKNWQALIKRMKGEMSWLQVGAPGPILNNVWKRPTDRFRGAMVILAASRGFVGTDGGLHHAAAALGKPAVVVWGHYTSPKQLGYNGHYNVIPPGGVPETGCGTLAPCPHCRDSMNAISVDVVERAVREAFVNGA